MEYQGLYNKIYQQKEELSSLMTDFWHQTSSFDTWFFWFNIMSVVIPLIILYFTIDKKRLFEISFYGYTVHLLWAKIDSMLAMSNYLVHPHSLIPLLPFGLNITAVTLPVAFMLLYQYCTNKKKNFYIYGILLSAVFAYGLASYSLAVDLLKMHKDMNMTYLFLIDLCVIFIAYWMTKLFLLFKNQITKQKDSSQ